MIMGLFHQQNNDSTPQQITDHRLQITDYRLQITDYRSQTCPHFLTGFTGFTRFQSKLFLSTANYRQFFSPLILRINVNYF